MSACSIFPDSDSISIYTDACAYAPDGTILMLAPKVVLLPSLNAAIAVQGDARLVGALAFSVPATFFEFDHLAAELTDLAAGIHEQFSAHGETLPSIIKLAGWSEERQRLEVWSVAVGETAHHPAGPAQLMPADAVHVSPGSPELFVRLAKAGLMDGNDLRCDTDAERLAILRHQRECAFGYEVNGGKPIRMVGGFAQRTTVTRDGVWSGIVERWPDQVGSKVGEA